MTPHSLFSIDPFGWLILDTALRSTVLIAVGTGLVWLFARSAAALRHRIWALLFIALLLLPALGVAVPGWDWPIVPRGWQVATTTVREASPSTTAASPPKTSSGPLARATGASVRRIGAVGPVAPTTPASVENNAQPILSPMQSDDAVAAARLAGVPAKDADSAEGRAAATVVLRVPRDIGWRSPGWVVRSWLCCRWSWDS